MKPILLTLLLIVTASLFAQTYTYTYTYDESGNRETRVLTLPELDKSLTEEEANSEEYKDAHTCFDQIDGQSISLFPNPTYGSLVVELSTTEGIITGEIVLISLSGRVILEQTLTEKVNHIDLTSLQAGTYIVKLTLGETTRDYKLVKL